MILEWALNTKKITNYKPDLIYLPGISTYRITIYNPFRTLHFDHCTFSEFKSASEIHRLISHFQFLKENS